MIGCDIHNQPNDDDERSVCDERSFSNFISTTQVNKMSNEQRFCPSSPKSVMETQQKTVQVQPNDTTAQVERKVWHPLYSVPTDIWCEIMTEYIGWAAPYPEQQFLFEMTSLNK